VITAWRSRSPCRVCGRRRQQPPGQVLLNGCISMSWGVLSGAMPSSLLGSRPGSHERLALRGQRLGMPGAALRAAGPSSIRDMLYARMEEISFRKSMALLSGAVAVAIAGAVAGILMSQPAGAARPPALRPPPVTQPTSMAPASARATPARTVHKAPRPARVTPSPASYTPRAAPADRTAPAGPAQTAAAAVRRNPGHGSRPSPPRGAGSWWYWAHDGRTKFPQYPRGSASQGNADPRTGDPRGGSATGRTHRPGRGGW
jgi:hypothetical protein